MCLSTIVDLSTSFYWQWSSFSLPVNFSLGASSTLRDKH